MDVVGIGALNVDFIVTRSMGEKLFAVGMGADSDKNDLNEERPVSDEEAEELLAKCLEAKVEPSPGGSAFNTVSALRSLRKDFSLGYVGVVGRPVGGADGDLVAAVATLEIDARYVKVSKGRPGVCVSFLHGQDRTLRTNPGCNREMAQHLQENFEEIVGYLAAARLVHVTSFFDEETPTILSQVLMAAKSKAPGMFVSFDPGHYWSHLFIYSADSQVSQAIRSILQVTDFLFLNQTEFEALGDAQKRFEHPDLVEVQTARKILRFCRKTSVIIVLKKYDEIVVFYSVNDEIIRQPRPNTRLLDSKQIEDSTGAGDVFAAGFIGAQLTPGMHWGNGVELGLQMAREKLKSRGRDGYDRFSGLMNRLLQSIVQKSKRRQRLGRSIFIGHSRSKEWLWVKNYIETHYYAEVNEFATDPTVGKITLERIEECLEQARNGICVVTNEGDLGYPRPNVVHEAGLLQGRLGFERVLLIVQEPCQAEWSNIDGFQIARFKHSAEETLERIQEWMKLAGFVERQRQI